MAKRQHTERTLNHARKELGMPAEKVERWLGIPGGHGKRKDLWGGIDVIALDGHPGSLGIQVCGETGVSSHRTKMRELVATWNGYGKGASCSSTPHPLWGWLSSGNRMEIWAWRQRPKKPGGRWEVKRTPLTVDDLEPGLLLWRKAQEMSQRED